MNSPDDKTRSDAQRTPNRPVVLPGHRSASVTPQDHVTDVAVRELQLYQLELVAQNETLREAKQALAESHDRYADLFELAPVGYLTLDEQGKITAVNHVGAELLGVERATLVGRNFAGFVAFDDADRWHLHNAHVLQQDEKLACEIRLKGKDNTSSYVRADCKRMLRDGRGSTVQLVLSDITIFKQLEFEMEQTQQLAHIGSWYWDAKTGNQVISQETSRIFGYERIPSFPDQRGLTWSVETWELLHAAMQEAIQSGVGYDLDLPALRKDGTPIWINTRCHADRGTDGDVCGLRGTVQDITDRGKANAQINFQAKLLNAIGQAVIATDLHGTITYMNDSAESLYGWTSANAIGRSILEVTVPDVSQSQAIEIMAQLNAGHSWAGEFAVRHSGGRIFTAEVHDTPIMDSSGKLIGIIGVSCDVSARKETEQLLAQSEVRYETVVAALSEGVVSLGRDGAITSCNPAAERILNLSANQVRGFKGTNPCWHAIREDGTPFPRESRPGPQVLSSGIPESNVVIGIVKSQGAPTWVSVNAMPIFKPGDPSPESVVVSFSDITERRRVVNELAIERKKLSAAFATSAVGFVLCDAQGDGLSMNATALALFGYASNEDLKRSVEGHVDDWELHHGDGKLLPFDEWPLMRAIRGDFVRNLELHGHNTSSGNTWVCNLTVSPVHDHAGEVTMILQTLFDITHAKQMERALHKTNIDLENARAIAEEASLAKSNFLSNMSHELRTPLNAILGFGQLLESGSPTPTASQTSSINQILKAGWYLLDLVNEILDLAQIESGKLVMLQETVPLESVLMECQNMVEPLAQKRGVVLHFPQFDVPYFINADRIRIMQALINLLSNAIKYNKPAGTVTTECALVPPNSIRISVRDTGPGLAAEQLAQLFTPFNRLGKETGPEQGTGIGLVVTKRLVELMGGVIGVDSAVGVGSVFWIELGLTQAPQRTVIQVPPVALAQPLVHGSAALRTVLYVEDNSANLELVEELIKRRPELRLLSARDGTLGVASARANSPDVILMDLHLPGISGIEAMNILQADPALAHIPVIALSAYAQPADIGKALEAGFFNYITKPIRVSEFLAALDLALESSSTKTIHQPPRNIELPLYK